MKAALDLLREIRSRSGPVGISSFRRTENAQKVVVVPDSDLDSSRVTEIRENVAAVRLWSSRYGEVWLALDPCIIEELEGEEQTREAPRPVIVPEDVARLRGKSEEEVRAVLEVVAAFPGARVVQ